MKSLEERMVSGDANEMLLAQIEFMEKHIKTQEKQLKQINKVMKAIKDKLTK